MCLCGGRCSVAVSLWTNVRISSVLSVRTVFAVRFDHIGIYVRDSFYRVGMMWRSFGDRSGIALANHFVSFWDTLGIAFGIMWVSFRHHLGIGVASSRDHTGIVLGSFWDHVGILLRLHVFNKRHVT